MAYSSSCSLPSHVDCNPDECFAARVQYMKANGGLAIAFQGATHISPRGFWHDKTIKSEQAKIIAQAKAKGNEAVPYSSVFGNS